MALEARSEPGRRASRRPKAVMSESNHEIRIDDLAEPVLTPIQQGARDALAGVTIDISS